MLVILRGKRVVTCMYVFCKVLVVVVLLFVDLVTAVFS